MAEHGALGQSGGAAGILQQRDVVGIDRRPSRRPGGAVDELPEGDDRRTIRDRGLRRAGLAPAIVLANDQAIEQAVAEKFQRGRQQRGKIAGHQHPRARIGQLVRQRDLAVERRQVHDAGACLSAPKKSPDDRACCRGTGRSRYPCRSRRAGRRGRGFDHRLEFSVTDRRVAEFDRRTRAVFGSRIRQQVRQRSPRERVVPVNAFGIKLFAGMGHRSPVIPGRALREPGILRFRVCA